MPAKKPLSEQHLRDYRPRFTEEDHDEILRLTAEFTELDGGNPVARNRLVREIFLYQMKRLRHEDKIKILTAIKNAA